ncbi:hypothetical protein HJC23_011976 [Cyclotella cryptica]|uniref:Uncharacterized protein n=1 Tax=Cyclotella cryptica TaxID=29204 RepID=A0ABD3QQY8_9STRA|eukprot:CCRYP_003014-RA/>CCRYP_003014-RA protein AED:0.24 eAED:0.24 QI:107/-1/1/1/-1/1/1/166/363
MGRDDDNDRLRAEQEERERNRRAVMERKRQWAVVDSDNENGDADANSAAHHGSSREDQKHRRRGSSSGSRDDCDDDSRRRRSKKHKRKSKHHRRSYSSSDDEDESDSDRERKRRHHHKDKKRHKDRKHKEKKKRRHKESSSHKKSKKHRDRSGERNGRRDDESYSSSSLSDTERELLENTASTKSSSGQLSSTAASFGKYGIIHYPSDFHKERIRRSFEQWLAEVKAVAAFTGPKHELLEYFKEYAEDYNTATLPHEKYYDYDKWEMQDYERKKREAEIKAGESAAGGASAHLDEFKHRELMAQRAKQKKLEELKLLQQGMTAEKREEMKHQARLRHEMAVAYKTGDEETRRRLQKRLEPEER